MRKAVESLEYLELILTTCQHKDNWDFHLTLDIARRSEVTRSHSLLLDRLRIRLLWTKRLAKFCNCGFQNTKPNIHVPGYLHKSMIMKMWISGNTVHTFRSALKINFDAWKNAGFFLPKNSMFDSGDYVALNFFIITDKLNNFLIIPRLQKAVLIFFYVYVHAHAKFRSDRT